MSDLDAVLERRLTDPRFRLRLDRDPAMALRDYDLTEEDRALLTGEWRPTPAPPRESRLQSPTAPGPVRGGPHPAPPDPKNPADGSPTP